MFTALIEVTPLPGCFLDPGEVNGASVRCYIPVPTIQLARSMLSEDLVAMNLQLVEVEWLFGIDEVEWEKPDDPTAQALFDEAQTTDSLIYGEFHTWGHDACDAI